MMKYTMTAGRNQITLNTETGKITGGTYPMREVIKDTLHAKWNPAEKCWESDKLAETIEEYKSYLTRVYKLSAVEERTTSVATVETEAAKESKPTYRKAFAAKVNGLCPRCHTYCYGDCMA